MNTKKPNVILVLTDDQGYGDLGCHGNPLLKTPNIDAFYGESARFTDYHVGPTCAPTRSGLMTGHHANSCGVWHTVGGRSLLRGNEITIADVFRQNGYRTGLFGKWHLGDNYPYRPQDRGFDEVVCHGAGGISQAPDWWGNDYFDDTYLVNGEPKAFKGYCTDVFFSEGMKFIEAHRDRPFLCFLTTNAPHSPYNVEKKYSDLYKGRTDTEDRANFYGMITNIDENFGKLREQLERLGIADNTILMFMTDNGTSCGGAGYNHCGLRGIKTSEYDGGHRVPFFMHWPAGGIVGGRDIHELTAHVDFMPTLMDLCGLGPELHPQYRFDGKSLKPLLLEESPAWPERAMVTDSQRLVNPVKWRKSAVMTNRWRLINGKELYDMTRDRGQTHDIAASHPEVVQHLRGEYEKWWAAVSRQFDEEIPISIGTEHEKETFLSPHDWRDPANPKHTDPEVTETYDYLVVHQGQIRQGKGRNGYWEIRVEQEGTYEFELRRWPKSENRAIQQDIPESKSGFRSDVIQETNHHYYLGGIALPFHRAEIEIGGIKQGKHVSLTDVAAVFELELKKGDTHLVTRFSGDGIERGAYFVYVRRKAM